MAEKVPPEVGNNLKVVLNRADTLLRDKGSKASKVSSSMLMDSSENGQPHKTSQGTADIEYERTQQLQNAPEGSVQHNGKLVATNTREATGHQSMESNSSSRGVEVVEQFEHGVYVTLIQNPDGTKDFKRVRFSKRRFAEQQAEVWWKENQERVFKKYSHRMPSTPSASSTRASNYVKEDG